MPLRDLDLSADRTPTTGPGDLTRARSRLAAIAVAASVTGAVVLATLAHDARWIAVPVPVLAWVAGRAVRRRPRPGDDLAHQVHEAAIAPLAPRHVVIVLVDRLDLGAARAVHYARTLAPSGLRAVHVDTDAPRADALRADWQRFGLTDIPLDVIDCPDRRLTRAVLEVAALAVADADTEVTLVVPAPGRERSSRGLGRRTQAAIARSVSALPRVNVTVVRHQVATTWPALFAPRPPAHDRD